nr:MAG: capsid protein [Chemarfal virus 251]
MDTPLVNATQKVHFEEIPTPDRRAVPLGQYQPTEYTRISEIVEIPCIVYEGKLIGAKTRGTKLFASKVGPMMPSTRGVTFLQYMGALHTHWKGGIHFKLTFTKTNYQAGKLALVFKEGVDTTYRIDIDQIEKYEFFQKIDLSNSCSAEMTCPFKALTSVLPIDQFTGTFFVYVYHDMIDSTPGGPQPMPMTITAEAGRGVAGDEFRYFGRVPPQDAINSLLDDPTVRKVFKTHYKTPAPAKKGTPNNIKQSKSRSQQATFQSAVAMPLSIAPLYMTAMSLQEPLVPVDEDPTPPPVTIGDMLNQTQIPQQWQTPLSLNTTYLLKGVETRFHFWNDVGSQTGTMPIDLPLVSPAKNDDGSFPRDKISGFYVTGTLTKLNPTQQIDNTMVITIVMPLDADRQLKTMLTTDFTFLRTDGVSVAVKGLDAPDISTSVFSLLVDPIFSKTPGMLGSQSFGWYDSVAKTWGTSTFTASSIFTDPRGPIQSGSISYGRYFIRMSTLSPLPTSKTYFIWPSLIGGPLNYKDPRAKPMIQDQLTALDDQGATHVMLYSENDIRLTNEMISKWVETGQIQLDPEINPLYFGSEQANSVNEQTRSNLSPLVMEDGEPKTFSVNKNAYLHEEFQESFLGPIVSALFSDSSPVGALLDTAKGFIDGFASLFSLQGFRDDSDTVYTFDLSKPLTFVCDPAASLHAENGSGLLFEGHQEHWGKISINGLVAHLQKQSIDIMKAQNAVYQADMRQAMYEFKLLNPTVRFNPFYDERHPASPDQEQKLGFEF